MSQNVLADAQFTIAAVLRPFGGFEFVYQGQAVTIPIVFPGTLDEDAGNPGFSPYLLKGVPVPLGAKMLLWFPAIFGQVDAPGIDLIDYKYKLTWRLRNVGDFQRRQRPYHLSKESFGAADTYLAGSQAAPYQQFVLPASEETVVYQQAEPSSPPLPTFPGPGRGILRSEEIAVPSNLTDLLPTVGLPLLPPNSAPNFNNAFPSTGPSVRPLGIMQQGVIDPRFGDIAPTALFRPYYTVAKGDELIISVFRDVTPQGAENWNFSTVDFQFSNLYGSNAFPPTGTVSHPQFPDLGIYVFQGSNPS